MIIIRRSPMTGIVHEKDIDVTERQLQLWASGVLIQKAMPNITPAEREFIMTGYTEEDWLDLFPGGDDD